MVQPQVAEPRYSGSPGPDAAVGVVAAIVLVAVTAHLPANADADADHRATDALQYALLVAASGVIALIRRRPHAAAALATLILCAEIARQYPDGPVWAVGWISLAGVSWQTSRRAALAWAGVMLAALTPAAMVFGSSGLVLPLIFIGWSAAAILSGDALRDRRKRMEALRERVRMPGLDGFAVTAHGWQLAAGGAPQAGGGRWLADVAGGPAA